MNKRKNKTFKLSLTLLGTIVFLVLSFGVIFALVSSRNTSMDQRSQAFEPGGEPPYAPPTPTQVPNNCRANCVNSQCSGGRVCSTAGCTGGLRKCNLIPPTATPTRRPTPTPTRRPTPTPTLNLMQCHPECPQWGCPAGYYCNKMDCPTYQGRCTPNTPTPTIPPTQCHAECSSFPCPADYRCETSGCPQYLGRCVQDNCRLNCNDSECTNGEHCSSIGCTVGSECSNYR